MDRGAWGLWYGVLGREARPMGRVLLLGRIGGGFGRVGVRELECGGGWGLSLGRWWLGC